MFKLFIGRALMCLPFAMLCWMLCFFLAWRSLQQKKQNCSGRCTDGISIVLRNTYHWNGLWGVAL